MKFNDAFDAVYEKETKRMEEAGEGKFGVTPGTAKILAMMWNICAEAKGNFDDIVYIDKKNNIVSTPLDEKNNKPSKKTAERESRNN